MNKLIALLLVAFTVAACVQDDEYDVPNVEATHWIFRPIKRPPLMR